MAYTESAKRWYKENKQQVIEANNQQRKLKILYIREKKQVPCADCGISYPYYVMDFDHLRDKKFLVAHLVNQGWNRIDEELSKCEVVCSNCHRIRTFKRSQGETL